MEETTITLKEIKTNEILANYFGISLKQLHYLTYTNKEKFYREFQIEKRNGKLRTIAAPNQQLKEIQRKIKDLLVDAYFHKYCVHGFLPDKSILSNAKCHTKKKYLLNIDLKDFFPTITSKRIYGMFLKYGVPKEVALCLTKLVSNNDVLPQGAPTSPIISNMICGPMDNELVNFSKKHQLYYTRYADDLSFSSNKQIQIEVFDYKNHKVGEALREIIEKNGFTINEEKVIYANCFQHQEVTGLIVNQFPNVKRKYIRNIRLLLHVYGKFGKQAASDLNYSGIKKTQNKLNEPCDIDFVIHGMLSFLNSVRGTASNRYYLYNNFVNTFNSIVQIPKIKLVDPNSKWRANIVVIEISISGGKSYQGTGFIVNSDYLVTADHVFPFDNDNELKLGTYKIFSVGTDKIPNKILFGSTLSLLSKILKRNSEEDWLIVKLPNRVNLDSFEFGDTHKIHRNTVVTVLGFPNYSEGNGYTSACCNVTSDRDDIRSHKHEICSVDIPLIHGISGGPVLNSQGKVVGIISAGVNTTDESKESVISGFIFIDGVRDCILQDQRIIEE